MHARMKIVSGFAAATVMVVMGAQPAAAPESNDNLNPTNDEYSHAAEWVATAGGGQGSSDASCVLESDKGKKKPRDAHYEWHSYPQPNGTYNVYLDCVVDGKHFWEEGLLGDEWYVVWSSYGVEPRDPEELVADALSRLRPPEAGIHTDPGTGEASMVGIDTWLWLDPNVYGYQEHWEYDGPVVGGERLLAVKVWAKPKPGGNVVWSSADGSTTCPDAGNPPGSCTYEFTRSSAGQPHTDAAGRPAYELTASYSYTGGYETYVMGELIDSGTLQDIPRTSVTYLPVAEAQAINTEN